MQLYVGTDDAGTDRHAEEPVGWPLPTPAGEDGVAGGWLPGEALESDSLLPLVSARGLLARPSERIYLAEELGDAAVAGGGSGAGGAAAGGAGAAGDGGAAGDAVAGSDVAAGDGVVRVRRARLVAPANWDGFVGAGFALDCAEHVLGAASGVTLPDGTPLGEALAQVRAWLASAEAQAGPLGKLRDLALGWRLRREGKSIGDAAFDAWVAATGADVDAFEDPTWTAVAAARDAALAAVEAVQHAVFPHLSEFEAHRYQTVERHVVAPIPPAHEHPPSSWVPWWVATADAAERARLAGGEDELDWQAARLESLLLGG